ncbi:hypothetical protein V1498_03735 [Peribacillus sp. SCS-26]|uniref:hypothetical protein n=1 Tax=Paraperibacillus marinus TaxID=3115295 RepID=UPI003906919B
MDSANFPQLSPPQFMYFNELKYSVGRDPLVDVGDIQEVSEGVYLIPVKVQGRRKAEALAAILNPQKELGNIIVNVQVKYRSQAVIPPEGIDTPREVEWLFDTALRSNRYYKFTEAREVLPGLTGIFPVFTKRVIQFFNDDLSDL